MTRRLFGPRRAPGELVGMHLGGADAALRQAVDQMQGEVEALRDEVGGLRRELEDAQNRLDFTERMLAQARGQGKLPPGAP